MRPHAEQTPLFLTVSPAALSSEGSPVLTHVMAGGGGGPFLLPRATALLSNCVVAGSLRSRASPVSFVLFLIRHSAGG